MSFGSSALASAALAGVLALEAVAGPALRQDYGYSSMLGGGYFGAVETAGANFTPAETPSLPQAHGFSSMFGGGYFGAVEMAGANVTPAPATVETSTGGFWRRYRQSATVKFQRLLVITELAPIHVSASGKPVVQPLTLQTEATRLGARPTCRVALPASGPVASMARPKIFAVQNDLSDADLLILAAHLLE